MSNLGFMRQNRSGRRSDASGALDPLNLPIKDFNGYRTEQELLILPWMIISHRYANKK
jgi:hypothetical protein